MAKQRIAILGGGLASLSAAYELSTGKNEGKYKIDIYQVGWRLGGKCATGIQVVPTADGGVEHRVLEHGPHVFFGTYHNAFRILRDCYQEMGRSDELPLSTCLETEGGSNPAFKTAGRATLYEHLEGEDPKEWELNVPLTLGDKPPGEREPGSGSIGSLLWALLKKIWGLLDVNGVGSAFPGEKDIDHVIGLEREMLEKIVADSKDGFLDDALRRVVIMGDLGLTIVRGILSDDLHKEESDGFDNSDLDKLDLREWLSRHGAKPSSVHSAVVQAFYELAISFDPEKNGEQRYAAGAALRAFLRIFLDWDQAWLWRMQGGMGDVVITPLFEVLEAKEGVTFHFFHRVEALEVDESSGALTKVKMAQQIEFATTGERYDPLVEYDHLPGRSLWPATPVDEFLTDEEKRNLEDLATRNLDLESAWLGTEWQDAGLLEIESREVTGDSNIDNPEVFDHVLLGISLGAIKHLSSPAMLKKDRWREMLENLATVPTQAAQAWFYPASVVMNGGDGKPVLASGALTPMPTHYEATASLYTENRAAQVTHLGYLYGLYLPVEPLPDPGHSPDVPGFHLAEAKAGLIEHLIADERGHSMFFPHVDTDWNIQLHDPMDRHGIERVDGQYWRININPSDQYVPGLPGGLEFRLPADEMTPFGGLYICGDWTRNGGNSGAAEVAVMSGRLASRAISGFPKEIYWEDDF